MIKIFEYATFSPSSSCSIDRNRYEVAIRLNIREFWFGAFSKDGCSPPQMHLISPKSRLDTVRAIMHFAPDIIHTRIQLRPYIIRQILRLKGVKHVLTIDGMPENGWLLGKWLAQDADCVVSVSRDTAEQAKEVYGVGSKVIYDGVDTKFFRPQEHSNERLKIMYVARLERHKGPLFVVELAKQFRQCDFEIYGQSGSLKEMIQKRKKNIRNLKIQGFVPRETLRNAYANSDIFLFPSFREPFGMVVLEALACGLPIVCFNAGGPREIVEHGKSGLLSNNFGEMAAHLEYLVENEDVRRKLSKSARERALEFDWSVIAPKWANLFEQVMG